MSEFDLKGLFETAQRLQSEMARVKDELGRKTVVGETGGGLVQVTASGKGDVMQITVDPSLLSAENKKMLEDLVTGAVNVALERARQLAQDEVARVGGGLAIPPGLFGGS
ncbi:MAG TPA: YbaB/EbfC family nucleoid-associated protein [Polyangia bacterium]